MVKKNWENPELMVLGLGATREEGETVDGKIFYQCKYCCERFLTKKGRDDHEKHCPNNGSMLPGEGCPIPTFS